MPENPRKDAFKVLIMERMRASKNQAVAKDDLIAHGRAERPELFDDGEACFPGCKGRHPKWRHEFDRAIYDLTQTRPPKMETVEGRRGFYWLGRGG